jgi:hypothetical protein
VGKLQKPSNYNFFNWSIKKSVMQFNRGLSNMILAVKSAGTALSVCVCIVKLRLTYEIANLWIRVTVHIEPTKQLEWWCQLQVDHVGPEAPNCWKTQSSSSVRSEEEENLKFPYMNHHSCWCGFIREVFSSNLSWHTGILRYFVISLSPNKQIGKST